MWCKGNMSAAYLVGGLCIGLVTGYSEHGPWRHLPPSFVRAGWALGVLAISSLLRTVPPCSWAYRCLLVGGLVHLLWPPLSYQEKYDYAQLGLLTEGVLLGMSALLLAHSGDLPGAVLLALMLVWVGVMVRHSRI